MQFNEAEIQAVIESCLWMQRLGFASYATDLESIGRKLTNGDWPPPNVKHYDPELEQFAPGLHVPCECRK